MRNMIALLFLCATPALASGVFDVGNSAGAGPPGPPGSAGHGMAVTCLNGAGRSSIIIDPACLITEDRVIVYLTNLDPDGCDVVFSAVSAQNGCEADVELIADASAVSPGVQVTTNAFGFLDKVYNMVLADNLTVFFETVANMWIESNRNKQINGTRNIWEVMLWEGTPYTATGQPSFTYDRTLDELRSGNNSNIGVGFEGYVGGAQCIDSGADSIVFGFSNINTGTAASIFGQNNINSGNFNGMCGDTNSVSGNSNDVSGASNSVSSDFNVVGGTTNTVSTLSNGVFGDLNTVNAGPSSQDENVGAGIGNTINGSGQIFSGTGTTIVGTNNTTNGLGTVTVGDQNIVNGGFVGNVVVGSQNIVDGIDHVTVGNNNTVNGDQSHTTVGNNNEVNGTTHVITGNDNFSFGALNVITGNESGALGGVFNTVTGSSSVAGGDINVVTGNDSLAYGTGNNVTATEGTATGFSHTVTGTDSSAHGDQNTASGDSGFATGTCNVVFGDDSFARGAGGIANGLASSTNGVDAFALRATEEMLASGGFQGLGDAQSGSLIFKAENVGALIPTVTPMNYMGNQWLDLENDRFYQASAECGIWNMTTPDAGIMRIQAGFWTDAVGNVTVNTVNVNANIFSCAVGVGGAPGFFTMDLVNPIVTGDTCRAVCNVTWTETCLPGSTDCPRVTICSPSITPPPGD